MTELISMLERLSEPVVVAIIALAGVLISATISALIAFVTSRKALYVNAVTVERSKWIEKLRANLAKYSGLAHSLFYKAKSENWTEGNVSPEYYELLRQLQDLRSLLKLQLNTKALQRPCQITFFRSRCAMPTNRTGPPRIGKRSRKCSPSYRS